MKLRIHYGITEKLRNYGKFTELRTRVSDYGQNSKHYGFVPRVTPESLLTVPLIFLFQFYNYIKCVNKSQINYKSIKNITFFMF